MTASKPRGITEISLWSASAFAIWQAKKHGLITPELIEDAVRYSLDIATVALPVIVTYIRHLWKKFNVWFKRGEA